MEATSAENWCERLQYRRSRDKVRQAWMVLSLSCPDDPQAPHPARSPSPTSGVLALGVPLPHQRERTIVVLLQQRSRASEVCVLWKLRGRPDPACRRWRSLPGWLPLQAVAHAESRYLPHSSSLCADRGSHGVLRAAPLVDSADSDRAEPDRVAGILQTRLLAAAPALRAHHLDGARRTCAQTA